MCSLHATLKLGGPETRHLGWGSVQPLDGTLEFTALRQGRIPLRVRAEAGLRATSALTAVFAAPAPRQGTAWWVWVAVAAAAVAAIPMVAFALRLRRRSR